MFVFVTSQHECSYQRGNVFLSLWLRIFLPPPASSGQLYSVERDVVEQNALLVEVQLREGDRLCFSAIFRDLMTTFKVRNIFVFLSQYPIDGTSQVNVSRQFGYFSARVNGTRCAPSEIHFILWAKEESCESVRISRFGRISPQVVH